MDDKLIILNKLMNGELVAHWQYEIAAKTCIGENQSYLVDQFEEHAKDEYDHYEKLMTAFLQRGGKPNLNLIETVKDALPITDELKSNISEYLRKFFHKSEESAIKAYESYLELLGDSDPDLADIISGIISDERDHDLDMERLKIKDNPNVVKNFSESSKEVKANELKTGNVIWVKGYGKVKVTSIQKHGNACLINFIDNDGSEDTISKDCNRTVKVYEGKDMKDVRKDINFAESVLGFSIEIKKLPSGRLDYIKVNGPIKSDELERALKTANWEASSAELLSEVLGIYDLSSNDFKWFYKFDHSYGPSSVKGVPYNNYIGLTKDNTLVRLKEHLYKTNKVDVNTDARMKLSNIDKIIINRYGDIRLSYIK